MNLTAAARRRAHGRARLATAASLATLLGILALLVFHLPQGAAASTASAVPDVHAVHASGLDAEAASPADDPGETSCATCGDGHHDAAAACAALLVVAILLALVRPRRRGWVLPAAPAPRIVLVAEPWRPRSPDLLSLGISRT